MVPNPTGEYPLVKLSPREFIINVSERPQLATPIGNFLWSFLSSLFTVKFKRVIAC